MCEPSKQEFDAYADDYRDILKESIKGLSEFGGEYFSEYKVIAVKESLGSTPLRILDFGCGDGKSCEFFRKYFPQSIITGVDVSSESIKVAQNKQIPDTCFIHFDGEKLPFEKDSFDLIFAAGVFHHIEKQKHDMLMKELYNVLDKYGKLFIFEHNPLNPFTRKVVRDCLFDEDVELIAPEILKKIVQDSAFQDISVSYTLFFPRYNVFKNFFQFEKHLKSCPLGAQYYVEASKVIRAN